MSTETERAIAQLLVATEVAHGTYEATVLGGRRDADWAGWYATYLLAHGLPDLLPDAALDAAGLKAILQRLDADYRRATPGSAWPSYYATRLGAMVA
jgi:hypothetical protein